jgi:hypothetical protein
MGEAGCLKDGVFKNLQVNGNIDLENAISKSMPLRKTVVYDYNGLKASVQTVDNAVAAGANGYDQVVKLPENAFVYKAYAVVKQVNTFSGGNIPAGGNINITGGDSGTIALNITLASNQNEVYHTELDTAVGVTGDITIGCPSITIGASGAVGTDTWAQVGKIVIVLDYFIL